MLRFSQNNEKSNSLDSLRKSVHKQPQADDDRSRLDAEWTVLNCVRELMHLATRGDSGRATYDQALALGGVICPELLGEDVSLIRRARLSDVAREFLQKAQAKSAAERQEISALSLLNAEIVEYEQLLSVGRNQQRTDQLKRRLTALKRAEKELDPTKHSENQLIFRDVYNVDRGLPEVQIGHGFKDFQIAESSFLRIRMLHPDRPEHISGADLLYERHFPELNQANVVAVQYKIWDDKVLPLNDKRLQKQLGRMHDTFCNPGLCERGSQDHPFRFPYCSAFLRPTDRLQRPDQKLASTGEHLPVCHIDRVATEGPRGGSYLDYESIRELSLNHHAFENLFSTGKLGSRTLTYRELEELHRQLQLSQESDRVVIHAQDVETNIDQLELFGEDIL